MMLSLPTLGASPACAGMWHVTADGSGDAPTIQAAIVAASPFDTVLVGPGTYSENLDTLGKFLILKGESGAAFTTIDGGRQGSVIRFTGGGRVEGLTIRNGQAFEGGGLFLANSNAIVVRDNIIEANYAGFSVDEGLGGGVFLEGSVDAALLEANIIRNNNAGDSGGGLYDEGGFAQPNLLSDNSILGNWCFVAGAGISIGSTHVERNVIAGNSSTHFGGGVDVLPFGVALIRNNTVVGNTVGNTQTNGAGIHVSGPAQVLNNIAARNIYTGGLAGDRGAGIFCDGLATNALVMCNDTWANNIDGIVGIPNEDPSNFSADPVFCDASLGDYHLAGFSPCLSGNNSCALLIGALEAGCTVSDLIETRAVSTGLSITPNPPRSQATIAYTLAPGVATAGLRVYDLRGRVVATLRHGDEPGLRGFVTWNGRDTAGNVVGSGVYIVRLEYHGGAVARKITWIR